MKKIVIIGIIIILLLPIFTAADMKHEEIDILSNILEDFQGEFVEGDIVFNGMILDEFIGQDQMDKIGREVVKELNIVGKEIDPYISQKLIGDYYAKEIIFEEDFSQINYYGYDKEKNQISINLNSYFNSEEKKGETYLCINIVKDDDFSKINDIIDRVESIFVKYNTDMEMTSCIIGSIDGKVSQKNMTNKVHKALKNIKGDRIDKYSDDALLSYTVYTPYIDSHMLINEEKINLNIAIRYNEYENKTYLWIGTPIITTGY